ncbi:MAG: metal ABC transporter substrate-binding protein [Pseudomonadota bacterium]|nr:metal ABC transporter substrate-binding protein [Pseudomonadota bacterium]
MPGAQEHVGGSALTEVRSGLVGLLIAASLLTAWPAAAALRVVTTTTDLASLASAVGGELVNVESIVPPAADPEAFEARPRDVEKVRQAKLIVRVGLGYDHWLDRLSRQVGDKRLMPGGEGYVDASLGIPLLEIRGEAVMNQAGHAHGAANPHYWLDPSNAIVITANIADALGKLMPAQREQIATNRNRFITELGTRRARWISTLAPFAGSKLIAYHNSWPYFARRFRLDVVQFIEPKAGVSPSVAHLSSLIAQGRGTGVRAVLHEPYAPDDASRFVARELKVPVVKLGISVGSVPGATDYLALLDSNVGALAKALSRPRSE